VLAVVEHAKYGNLRDYLRNKRMHNYFAINLQRNVNAKSQISNLMSLLSSSTSSHDKYEESINFKDLLMFAHQISLGMDYLHTKNVLHRDLAARNILVCENRVAKIADFGLARDMEQNYYYKRQTDVSSIFFLFIYTDTVKIQQVFFDVFLRVAYQVWQSFYFQTHILS
jgi:serine/threonine protein kinase